LKALLNGAGRTLRQGDWLTFKTQFNYKIYVDFTAPGILEIEIGRLLKRRIEMRERGGSACTSKVERSGEDPSNDEAVLVSLTFECATKDVVYDAQKLIAAHGPRAWQVVTIFQGDAQRQIMLNAESPPVPRGSPTDQAGAK
jgi:hypothetical protein